MSEDDDEMEDPPEVMPSNTYSFQSDLELNYRTECQIRLVPSNPESTLQPMFDALNEMQLAHPDDDEGSTDAEAPMDMSTLFFLVVQPWIECPLRWIHIRSWILARY